jgi:chemotaxis protein methyltransferase CheR
MQEDISWIAFFQWALPKLRLHWPGFRKVHRQVRKRVHQRIQALHLASLAEYRRYLESHPDEWRVLDTLCHITISRFFRDKQLYALLARQVLPKLVKQAQRHGENRLRIWSAGCASGEEPYSLSILWQAQLREKFQSIDLQILATDADPQLLHRARAACYPFSSLKHLPTTWRILAFTPAAEGYCLRPEFKKSVLLVAHDIRTPVPTASLHLILCRNLVYTYFEPNLQQEITRHFSSSLQPSGVLIIGIQEMLPEPIPGFAPLFPNQGVYIKS